MTAEGPTSKRRKGRGGGLLLSGMGGGGQKGFSPKVKVSGKNTGYSIIQMGDRCTFS